jgi:hypothetical protein
MNEELTKELNALQEKFNKEIEDVKKKYEKKEMTLDEIAHELMYSNFDTVKHKLLKYKEEIINALKN